MFTFRISFNPLIALGTSIVTIYGNGLFVFVTAKKEEIIIAKKYKYVKNGSTNFMIVDENGRHFNVKNSFWFWKWDAIENWTNIKLLEKQHVSYYGYRLPFFNMFPNIVSLNPEFKMSGDRNYEVLKDLHL